MSAQLQAIFDDLDKLGELLNYESDDFGERCLDADVEAIRDCTDARSDPAGNRWPDLNEEYERWKAQHFPGQGMGHLYDLMLAEEQLRGERTITPRLARMVYGISWEAKLEATRFQQGNGPQPPRGFYSLSAAAVERKDELHRERFHRPLGSIP
jgi:hypothetical protein